MLSKNRINYIKNTLGMYMCNKYDNIAIKRFVMYKDSHIIIRRDLEDLVTGSRFRYKICYI